MPNKLSEKTVPESIGSHEQLEVSPSADSKASTLSIAELVFSSITQTSFAINSHHTNAKRVTVQAEKGLSYVIDGEVKTADKLEVEISPKSLSVMVAAED